MDEQRLMDELRARAADDARAFRESNPGETPSERWIENSYTAALPLAKDSAGFDPGLGPHPQLFEVYRREIGQRVGERASSRENGTLTQQPTPGEH
jgi:hypothetical protein